MRKIKLILEVGRRDYKNPAGSIMLNGKTIHNGDYVESEYEFEPLVGTNVLEISLTNKRSSDTKISGNKIVEDIYVVVKDIVCQVTKESAGNLDKIGEYRTNEGEDIKTYGYLSYNGVYKFIFDYPFFVFKKNKLFYQ
jgi:hypothetical protein